MLEKEQTDFEQYFLQVKQDIFNHYPAFLVIKEQALRVANRAYWSIQPMSQWGIVGRIKGMQSLQKKLEKKYAEDPDLIHHSFYEYVNDFVGVRIVVNTNEEIKKCVQFFCDSLGKEFTIIKRKASILFEEDSGFFREREFEINERDSGYVGVHLVLEYIHPLQIPCRKIEIQIRTKLEHAWQEMEHPLYKKEGSLSKHLKTIKKMSWDQLETCARLFEYFLTEAHKELPHNERVNVFHDYDKKLSSCPIEPSQDVKRYIGTFVKSEEETKIYFVTNKLMLRWLRDSYDILPAILGPEWIENIHVFSKKDFSRFKGMGDYFASEEDFMIFLRGSKYFHHPLVHPLPLQK